MVIDSSALMSILLHEDDWQAMATAIDQDPIRLISVVSVIECSLVALARLGRDGVDDLDLILNRIQAEQKPSLPSDIPLVREAYYRFGKGRHPASLNFGDCFSYALAASSGQPLLFKGEDFSRTDIPSVL